jgi:crotonobetainyl-CoA:carnitine CoA-transferase CaiB-like acyl-CoA transferase
LSERPLPLAGRRVISFGAFVAGNTSALLLAELGADVVKVEARSRPEVLRTPQFAIGPWVTEPSGATNTVMMSALARSTRGLSIDLDNEAARPLFHRLVGEVDAVIENFGGSTLARWGCAYDDLLVDNPSLVMLSMSGFGRTGPLAGYLAYATNICGYVGLASAWGYNHGTHSDYITGTTGALATAAAIARARRTGQPTHLDVSQIDALVGPMASLLLDPLVNGRDHEPAPNEVPGAWLAGVFPAVGHDAWFAIELEDADDWAVLCGVLGRADLVTDDPAVAAGRRDELAAAFAAWVADRTPHTAMHLLQRQGLAAGPVQNSEDIWRDPQLRDRGFVVATPQPDLGVVRYPQSVYGHLSATPGRMRRAGPRVGDHTDEILREWLSLGDDELAELSAAGAIFDVTRDLAP